MTMPHHEDLVRDPILRAKVTAPARPAWLVPRNRLAGRIAERALTSITGPPGAGKTVAAASWADGFDHGPVAWVTLDEFDNDPEVFWSYVLAALRPAGVAPRWAASVLAPGEPGRRDFLIRVAAELAGHDPPLTLVLDEFHCVTNPAVMAGLAFLLRNARPGLRVVCASRTDPPLPLHRYRLTGDVTEIRARDLAFTVPEAAQLMTQHGVTLPKVSLADLTERSEGWAAGLRMAAMSMADHPDPEQFVKSLVADDSAITAYLVEEVLNTRSPEVRDLLLRTSILDQVNGDIAALLTDGRAASAELEAMARGNAFVQPVGQGWYRYHNWFRAVLHLKLRCENPRIVAGLHRRAGEWYERNGMPNDAARHATRGADPPALSTRAPAPRRSPDAETPVIVDPLSGREREVLRHVSDMLDTADIAAEMHISINTVKTHLKSSFNKLGASDRRAAVRRARQLDLL
jgi:LuxR family maltose regulon positive regulatory protein